MLSGEMHLIKGTFSACCSKQGTLRWVVESYEWTKLLSTGQTELSSGRMHLIKGTFTDMF